MSDLKTNYKDDVLNTSKNPLRKYNMIQNEDGTVSFMDVTVYSQNGDNYAAADVNAQNKAINALNNSLENLGNMTLLRQYDGFKAEEVTLTVENIDNYKMFIITFKQDSSSEESNPTLWVKGTNASMTAFLNLGYNDKQVTIWRKQIQESSNPKGITFGTSRYYNLTTDGNGIGSSYSPYRIYGII